MSGRTSTAMRAGWATIPGVTTSATGSTAPGPTVGSPIRWAAVTSIASVDGMLRDGASGSRAPSSSLPSRTGATPATGTGPAIRSSFTTIPTTQVGTWRTTCDWAPTYTFSTTGLSSSSRLRNLQREAARCQPGDARGDAKSDACAPEGDEPVVWPSRECLRILKNAGTWSIPSLGAREDVGTAGVGTIFA